MKQILFFIVIFSFMFSGLISCSGPDSPDRYLEFRGHKIHYEVRGDLPKTLVFIHGWTGSTGAWKYQLDSFGGYRVIALDLPGNGRSSRDEKAEYTMDLFADSVVEVLKNENIQKAFFIGHSMGFSVAEVIAVKYPDRCAGICSIDGVHFDLPDDPAVMEKWIQFNRDFVKSLANEEGREAFINALFLPDTPKLLKDEIFRTSRKVPLSIGRSMIRAAETDRKYWKKRRLDIPCLAVYSGAFHLPPAFKTDFMKTYPRAKYHEVSGVSHFFMLEIPYRVNQIIADYLAKTYR